MGLLDTFRARTQEKVDTARSDAEDRARRAGADRTEVHAAGEKAARRKQRRIRFSGYGGAGGTAS